VQTFQQRLLSATSATMLVTFRTSDGKEINASIIGGSMKNLNIFSTSLSGRKVT
jgi:hypothetical protein